MYGTHMPKETMMKCMAEEMWEDKGRDEEGHK
jgi:hypothetical protein